jgi:hypothetical protein
MNGTIHIELERPCDAEDLVEFLAARGLAASVTSANDHCELEVTYAVPPAVRLRQEFEAALGSWLEQSERPLVPVSDTEHEYVLRPPGD